MKHTFDIKSVVLGTVLGVAVMFSLGAATDGRRMWTHKIISGHVGFSQPSLEQQLDQAAADRWEVAAAASDEGKPIIILRRLQ